MSESNAKPDWSQKCWKEMLVFQRKTMWPEDTLDKLAVWLDLRQGMTAVDVGCGLGYLGYTFWRYFGKGGRYIGIDKTPELVRDASEGAKEWVADGEASFKVGDVYSLLLPDDYADWTMCQTLLIHLEKPHDALKEMVRITKPGGLITCIEPDNVNPALGLLYNSVPEISIDDHLLYSRVLLTCRKGRIKLGNGDPSYGQRVPHAFEQLGLTGIEVRANDRVHYIEPPYDDPLQKSALDNLKQWLLDEERQKVIRAREKEEFLAGGGDRALYDLYVEKWRKNQAVIGEQIKSGSYHACSMGGMYITKGRKPISGC